MSSLRCGRSARVTPGRRRAGYLGLALIVLISAACNSKSVADQATDELNAGLAASAVGNTAEATTHFQTCVSLDPRNKFCIFNLGVIGQFADRPLDAENAYRLALLIDPDFAPALYNLAILRYNAGSFNEAIDLYRRLIVVDPNSASGHFNLGIALLKTGSSEEGMRELQLGVSLNPALVIPSPLPGPSPSAQ